MCVGHEAVTDAEPLDLAEAAEIGSPDDLATIIYTSGTTGQPQGRDDLQLQRRVDHGGLPRRSYGWTREDLAGKRVVSYLPMAHIAERMVSHYMLLGAGIEVTTCPETSMLTTYLGEVHPNIVFGVPRVWEKVLRRRHRAAGRRPGEGREVQRRGGGGDAARARR